MENLIICCSFGEQRKIIEITSVSGGGDMYFFFIDRYFVANFMYLESKWVAHSNKPELTADDIQIIGELIDRHFQLAH